MAMDAIYYYICHIGPYMPIYDYIYILYIYIYIYMAIYIYIVIYCMLGVWTCILDVWTCIWVSGLVFECVDLYSGYCIPVGCLYTCRMWLWRVHSPPPPPRGLCACRRRFFFVDKCRPWDFWTCILWILPIFIDLRPSWSFCQKVGNLIKWLCQLDAHRNSLQKDVLYRPRCFSKVWFLKQFLDFANLGLNVNLKNRGRPKGGP